MARTGRPRKPTALKKLEGNPGRRALGNEPKPPVAPSDWAPPEHLRGEARREWRRLVGPLVRCGILTIADRDAFASYCVLHDRHVRAEFMIARDGELTRTPNGHAQPSPWITISRDALTLKVRYMAELGLTPSARSRMGAGIWDPPPKGATGDSAPPAAAPESATEENLHGKRYN